MLLDNLTQIATSYAPTALGSNICTQGIVDRITAMDDGAGQDILFTVYVATSVTSAGSATVEFQLLGNATDPTFASSNVVLVDTGSAGIPKATLVAGYRAVSAVIPRGAFKGYESSILGQAGAPCRYLTLNVIIGTAVLTAGAFNAYLTNNAGIDNIAYKSGFTV